MNVSILKVPVANYRVVVSDSISDIVSIDNTIWIKGSQKPYELISNDYDMSSTVEDVYYVVYNTYGSLQFNAYADCDFKINPLYCFIKILGVVHMVECFIYQGGKVTQLSTTLINPNGYLDTSDGTISPSKILLNEVGYSKGSKIVGTIPKKNSETYTPKTTDQIITGGQYLDGNQIIKGDTNLQPGYIAKGVSLFGVVGTRGGAWATGSQGLSVSHMFTSDTSWSTAIVIPINVPFIPGKAYVSISCNAVYSTSYFASGKLMVESGGSQSQLDMCANASATYYTSVYVNLSSLDKNNIVVTLNGYTNVKSSARSVAAWNAQWIAIE